MTAGRRYRPGPGWLLVEPVETEDTFAGGRIIMTAATLGDLTRTQATCLAVGTTTDCDDDTCPRSHTTEGRHHVLDAAPGDWLLLRPRSLVPVPDDPRQTPRYLVPQDAVMAVIR